MLGSNISCCVNHGGLECHCFNQHKEVTTKESIDLQGSSLGNDSLLLNCGCRNFCCQPSHNNFPPGAVPYSSELPCGCYGHCHQRGEIGHPPKIKLEIQNPIITCGNCQYHLFSNGNVHSGPDKDKELPTKELIDLQGSSSIPITLNYRPCGVPGCSFCEEEAKKAKDKEVTEAKTPCVCNGDSGKYPGCACKKEASTDELKTKRLYVINMSEDFVLRFDDKDICTGAICGIEALQGWAEVFIVGKTKQQIEDLLDGKDMSVVKQ